MSKKDITREEMWAKQKICSRDIDYHLWYRKKKVLKNLAELSHTCIFTVDVYNECYNFASEGFSALFGYNSAWLNEIHKHGDYLEDHIHPNDRDMILELQIKHSKFIYNLPPEQRNDFKNSYQFRIRNARKEFINVISNHQVIQVDNKDKAWIIMGIMEIAPDQTPLEQVKYSSLNLKTGRIWTPSLTENRFILTNREKEILSLINQGFLSKEISEKLNISIHTVNNHRKNILSGLGASNSVEAINLAKRNGLIL